jgi:uncharacterized membrane protein
MAVLFTYYRKYFLKLFSTENDNCMREDDYVKMAMVCNQYLLDDLSGRYAAKYFYMSMIGAIFLFACALTLYFGNSSVILKIWIPAIILIIIFTIVLISQRKSHNNLDDAMKKYSKSHE